MRYDAVQYQSSAKRPVRSRVRAFPLPCLAHGRTRTPSRRYPMPLSISRRTSSYESPNSREPAIEDHRASLYDHLECAPPPPRQSLSAHTPPQTSSCCRASRMGVTAMPILLNRLPSPIESAVSSSGNRRHRRRRRCRSAKGIAK